MIEIPRSAGASGSVRQSTDRRSAPLRSQPVAEEIQLLRPWMIHLSPENLAVVRTPSPGGGDATLALPLGSVAQNPASGAPACFKNGGSSRLRCSSVPPIKSGNSPRTVPISVSVTLALARGKSKVNGHRSSLQSNMISQTGIYFAGAAPATWKSSSERQSEMGG